MRDPRVRARRFAAALAAGSLALTLSTVLAPHDVEACGGFFSRAREAGRKPSLAYEQVLIVHDPAAEKEHFVREVVFRGGAEPFGFVVPTPTQPVVAKVEKSPFLALRRTFPFIMSAPPGEGFGNGHGRLGGGVTVLDVSKVGSFTAFVLAADNEKGLAGWLADNGLASTPEADAWLAHYVRMGFYYVAMRYDPPDHAAAPRAGASPKAEAPLKAETIRISFSTPMPYYPYFEPRGAPIPAGETPPVRLLELWVVSPARVTPVAARTVAGKTSWVRPMREGTAVGTPPGVVRTLLDGALPGELQVLTPAGPVAVQTFQDQKYSREGYGDVLFAPEARVPLDAAKVDKLRPLLGILDPALVPQSGTPPPSSP